MNYAEVSNQSSNNLIIDVVNSAPNKQSIVDNKQSNNTGLGLKNIQQRIRLLFGDEANLSIHQLTDKFIATMSLPIIQEVNQ